MGLEYNLVLSANEGTAQFNGLVIDVDDLEYLWNLTAIHVLNEFHLL